MDHQSSEKKYKKGLWTEEEDKILMEYINVHGKGKWNHIAKKTGLKRCGKSCRLRWMNYLSPNVKRGNFTEEEEDLIIRLHNLLGNRWALIAKRVPGRTDNQVKNYWNTHLTKKLAATSKQQNGTSFHKKEKASKTDISSSKKSITDKHSSEFINTFTTATRELFAVDEGIQITPHQVSPDTPDQLSFFSDTYPNSFWFFDNALELSTEENEFLNGY